MDEDEKQKSLEIQIKLLWHNFYYLHLTDYFNIERHKYYLRLFSKEKSKNLLLIVFSKSPQYFKVCTTCGEECVFLNFNSSAKMYDYICNLVCNQSYRERSKLVAQEIEAFYKYGINGNYPITHISKDYL